MGQFATARDVADRFEGDLDEKQMSWLDTKIEDAETILLTELPRLGNVELLTALDLGNARRVICDAVLRVLRNPGGFRQEGHGPFSGNRHEIASTGQLFFTPKELAVFQLVKRRRVGMIGVTPAPWGQV